MFMQIADAAGRVSLVGKQVLVAGKDPRSTSSMAWATAGFELSSALPTAVKVVNIKNAAAARWSRPCSLGAQQRWHATASTGPPDTAAYDSGLTLQASPPRLGGTKWPPRALMRRQRQTR
jgi:hypothetical protein